MNSESKRNNLPQGWIPQIGNLIPSSQSWIHIHKQIVQIVFTYVTAAIKEKEAMDLIVGNGNNGRGRKECQGKKWCGFF